jgi:hypothetical protein
MPVSQQVLEKNLAGLFTAQNKRYQRPQIATHIIDNKAGRLNKLVNRLFDVVAMVPASKKDLTREQKINYLSSRRERFISAEIARHLRLLSHESQQTTDTEQLKVFISQWCQKLAELNCALFCNTQGQLKAHFQACMQDGILPDFVRYCAPTLIEQRQFKSAKEKLLANEEASETLHSMRAIAFLPEASFESALIGAYNEFIFQGLMLSLLNNNNPILVKTLFAEIQTQHSIATMQQLEKLRTQLEYNETTRLRAAKEPCLSYTDQEGTEQTTDNDISSQQHVTPEIPAIKQAPADSYRFARWAGVGVGCALSLITLPVSLPLGLYLAFNTERDYQAPDKASKQFAAGFYTGFTLLTAPLKLLGQKLASALFFIASKDSDNKQPAKATTATLLDVLQAHNGDRPNIKTTHKQAYADSYDSPYMQQARVPKRGVATTPEISQQASLTPGY